MITQKKSRSKIIKMCDKSTRVKPRHQIFNFYAQYVLFATFSVLLEFSTIDFFSFVLVGAVRFVTQQKTKATASFDLGHNNGYFLCKPSSIMSLQCLCILGSKNEPIYYCSPAKSPEAAKSEPQRDLDGFGFLESMKGNEKSIHHEVCLSSLIDAFRTT